MKLFLENIKRLTEFKVYFAHPSEIGGYREQQNTIPKENQAKISHGINTLNIDTLKDLQAEQIKTLIQSQIDRLSLTHIKNFSSEEFSKLTPEQQIQYNNIINGRKEALEFFQTAQRDLYNSKLELTFKQGYESAISKKIEGDNPTPEDISSPEYNKILENIDTYQKRLLELDEMESILLKEAKEILKGRKINEKLSEEEINKMETTSSIDFLSSVPINERLRYVTLNNIDGNDLISGKAKECEINFTYNGKFNRELYLQTTAGMVLPLEIRKVMVGGEEFARKPTALKGEFFNESGKRLIIQDQTKITVSEKVDTSELSTLQKEVNLEKYTNELDKKIVTEASKRGIPENIALSLFSETLKNYGNNKNIDAYIEDAFVELDRKKGQFYSEFNKKAELDNGKLSIEFISYFSGQVSPTSYKNIATSYGYNETDIERGEKFLKESTHIQYNGGLDMEKLGNIDISAEEINRIRSIKKFVPGSKDAQLLFRIATKVANLPENWASSESLHYILKRESNGGVGRLNYTIKGMSISNFKALAINNSRRRNPIGARSTASGLGQLLLSNVDKYYPSGRKGIGDPIEEAIGFIGYIKDRYGNPDIARSVYGRIGSYQHPKKGRQYKGFREGY